MRRAEAITVTTAVEAITVEGTMATMVGEAITVEVITAAGIIAVSIIVEVINIVGEATGMTATTLSAGRTTATSGSAAAGTVGTAVGMRMAWVPAGFISTAYGSGTQ